MVVDFAVVNNPDVLILVGKWLMAGLDVNNAQPPHCQTDIFLDKKPFVVGAAVHNALIHAGEQVALDMPVPIREKNAADSTHINPSLRSISRSVSRRCSYGARIPGTCSTACGSDEKICFSFSSNIT